MELAELQSKLLENTRRLNNLSKTMAKLPECDARKNLDSQFKSVLTNIAILGNLKDTIAPKVCDFGFRVDCPKCICRDCPEWNKIFSSEIQ